MARNLIQRLGLMHIFTQSGWLILFSPDHLSGQHKLGKATKHFLFPRTSSFRTDVLLSYCITPPWGKPSNLWLSWVYSFRPRVLSEYELDEFNLPHTGTTLRHPQNWLGQLRCKIPLQHLASSSLGNIFWGHSHFSPKQPEPQTHRLLQRPCLQPANTTFTTLMATYLTHTFNNALT